MNTNADVIIEGSDIEATLQTLDKKLDIDYLIGLKGDKGDAGPTGPQGVGIASVVINNDYTVTFNLTDGSTYTTPVLKGEQGDKGDTGDTGATGATGAPGATGKGISSIALNSDYTLTINYTDGTSTTTLPIRGAQGQQGIQGAPGKGIVSIAKTGTSGLVDTYTITFSDNTTTAFTVTNGLDGTDGARGDKGETGNDGNGIDNVWVDSNGYLHITFTETSTEFVSTISLIGPQGQQGQTGQTGATGATGKGITSIQKTGTSGLVDTYTITYSDDTTSTFTVTNGADGSGSGDMTKSVYDTNNNGKVDKAEGDEDGLNIKTNYAKKSELPSSPSDVNMHTLTINSDGNTYTFDGSEDVELTISGVSLISANGVNF